MCICEKTKLIIRTETISRVCSEKAICGRRWKVRNSKIRLLLLLQCFNLKWDNRDKFFFLWTIQELQARPLGFQCDTLLKNYVLSSEMQERLSIHQNIFKCLFQKRSFNIGREIIWHHNMYLLTQASSFSVFYGLPFYLYFFYNTNVRPLICTSCKIFCFYRVI